MNLSLQAAGSRLRTLRSSLLACYRDEDLHQLRVTLRRMRAALLGKDSARESRPQVQQLRKELGALARSINSARDWDTLVASARDELRPEQFRDLQALLEQRRETARAQVYRMFHSLQWRATLDSWEAHLQQAGIETGGHAPTPGELANRLTRANAAGRKALSRGDDRSWHKLRIAIKELRYGLDMPGAQAMPAPFGTRLLDECETLQELLGGWHDTVVHRQLLDAMAEQGLLDPTTPAGRAADALGQALAASGRQLLEQTRLRLGRADLHPAAAVAGGHN